MARATSTVRPAARLHSSRAARRPERPHVVGHRVRRGEPAIAIELVGAGAVFEEEAEHVEVAILAGEPEGRPAAVRVARWGENVADTPRQSRGEGVVARFVQPMEELQ